MASTITIEEMLAANEIFQTNSQGGEGWTREELREASGWSLAKLNSFLRRAKAEGRLRVGKRRSLSVCNQVYYKPVYWLVNETAVFVKSPVSQRIKKRLKETLAEMINTKKDKKVRN